MKDTLIEPMDENCPMYQLFDLLGKKWMYLILVSVGDGVHSFSGLLRKLPKMSSKILSDRLDDLIKLGYIERHVTSEKPLKITYQTSILGQELAIRLGDIGRWLQEDRK